jgi:hypothetical protein
MVNLANIASKDLVHRHHVVPNDRPSITENHRTVVYFVLQCSPKAGFDLVSQFMDAAMKWVSERGEKGIRGVSLPDHSHSSL